MGANEKRSVDRRAFLRLGGVLSAGLLAGCAGTREGESGGASEGGLVTDKEKNLEVWRENAGVPYEIANHRHGSSPGTTQGGEAETPRASTRKRCCRQDSSGPGPS